MKAFLLEQPDQPAVSIDELNKLGVLYRAFEVNDNKYEEPLNQLCTERGYKNRDFIKLTPETPDLYKKLDIFFTEHYHLDEEIRFILDGCGYFDVRDLEDRWVRIVVEKGDLIILPANIHHRFTLSDEKYVHAMRLFQDQPKWEAIPRAK